MIKIFINEHPLVISDDSEDLFRLKNLRLMDDDNKSLMVAVDMLENSDRNLNHFGIFVPTVDEKDTFKRFKSHYREIQAAGGVVLNGEGDVLLIKRQGKWDLPKGKKDEEEKLEKAAVREVKEECGVKDVKLGDFITKSYHTYMLEGHRVLKTTNWFFMHINNNEQFKPQQEENITQVQWFKIADLKLNELDTYNSIRDVMQVALKG
ncbi:MAG TPA: NUDIX domain-containing protein [Bacteroidia bacterium]|nr:NUDIX domain-containing protein [Bacteroidia bacterium]